MRLSGHPMLSVSGTFLETAYHQTSTALQTLLPGVYHSPPLQAPPATLIRTSRTSRSSSTQRFVEIGQEMFGLPTQRVRAKRRLARTLFKTTQQLLPSLSGPSIASKFLLVQKATALHQAQVVQLQAHNRPLADLLSVVAAVFLPPCQVAPHHRSYHRSYPPAYLAASHPTHLRRPLPRASRHQPQLGTVVGIPEPGVAEEVRVRNGIAIQPVTLYQKLPRPRQNLPSHPYQSSDWKNVRQFWTRSKPTRLHQKLIRIWSGDTWLVTRGMEVILENELVLSSLIYADTTLM